MKLNEFKTQLKETLKDNYIDGSLTLSQYDFLDDLRDSGITNMFGAAPYLMEAFELNKSEAKRVLIDWIKQNKQMSNFDKIPFNDYTITFLFLLFLLLGC